MSLEKEASDAEKYVLDRVKDCSEDNNDFMIHNYLNENEAFFDKIYMNIYYFDLKVECQPLLNFHSMKVFHI